MDKSPNRFWMEIRDFTFYWFSLKNVFSLYFLTCWGWRIPCFVRVGREKDTAEERWRDDAMWHVSFDIIEKRFEVFCEFLNLWKLRKHFGLNVFLSDDRQSCNWLIEFLQLHGGGWRVEGYFEIRVFDEEVGWCCDEWLYNLTWNKCGMIEMVILSV